MKLASLVPRLFLFYFFDSRCLLLIDLAKAWSKLLITQLLTLHYVIDNRFRLIEMEAI